MKLILSMFIFLSVSVATADDAGIVNLTSGGSYQATDGTKINCEATVVNRDKGVACYCNTADTLVIVRTNQKGSDILATFNSKEACLKELKQRPDCN